MIGMAGPQRDARENNDQRSGEDGSIILAAALCMFLIMGMTLMAMIIGRQSYTRREMQTAVDGLALMGAHNLQQNGFPYSLSKATYYAKKAYKSGGKNAQVLSALVIPQAFEYKGSPRNYRMVHATLKGRMTTWQNWLPTKYLEMTVSSYAQVNEQWFGDKWPVIVFVLDASDSMTYPLLGSTAKAWTVLKNLVLAYAKNTFPARNGLVTFNDKWVKSVFPSKTSANNLSAITFALNATGLIAGTNTADALKRARTLLNPFSTADGKNVIMITDGEPTRGSGCVKQSACCWNVARTQGTAVRKTTRAALFTVEIRRTNYTKQTTTFLQGISGQPGTNGNNKAMHYQVQSVLGVQAFLNALTRSICAWGPLHPRPGTGYDKVRRPRGSRKNPTKSGGKPQRIFAFIRHPGGKEVRIPLVKNRNTAPLKSGWEYYVDPKGDAHVILSIKSCNEMGKSPQRRLVVRWDDPVLVAQKGAK